jgi:hypothetical protein
LFVVAARASAPDAFLMLTDLLLATAVGDLADLLVATGERGLEVVPLALQVPVDASNVHPS